MANSAKQVSAPALIVFELQNNTVVNRFVLPDDVLRDTSVFTSIVVDIIGKGCKDAYAYITDMGSNAIVVYSLTDNTAWRIEHPHFNFDPNAGIYKVGGIDFYWNDGVSSAALSRPKKDGYRDLYLHPTSSTKQFKMSTKLLRNKNAAPEDIIEGVEVVGDRGPKSQATACDFDLTTNVLFFTQVSKNGFGCWNVERPFIKEFTPIVMKDCSLMEFPNDIKVDHEGNLWVLSDRQARFLYEAMDFNQVNFRVLTAPIAQVIQGTPCEKNKSNFCFFKRMKIK
ncbi:L-dopachrome tautomerase yellow-f-like [Pectinophora gossypiella]|uniref:L-dopachrome tautomerase yellow-f-like n=1 Tax=Pectinophora gossypiella TaxID=13191 RepID=UPI00214E0F64|nr:L-dopachrome tautomerase yellow-f-like [Pectinophora gossypiella]